MIKLALNIILISNPKIGIYGAAISNVISYLITLLILISYIKLHEKIKFEIKKFILKPAIICCIMYIIMKITYKIVLINSQLIKTFTSIALGMTVYLILIIATKLITKRELKLLKRKG